MILSFYDISTLDEVSLNLPHGSNKANSIDVVITAMVIVTVVVVGLI